MTKAEVIAWLVDLPDGAPEFRAVADLRSGARAEDESPKPEERYLSLAELSKQLGFRDRTTLSRLKVQRAGEQVVPGGRLRYRLSRARAYLKSEDCRRIRETLRTQEQQRRKAKEGEA